MTFFFFLLPVIQSENECLREQISVTNKELEITKEKLYTLEQAWGNMSASGQFHLLFSPGLRNQL